MPKSPHPLTAQKSPFTSISLSNRLFNFGIPSLTTAKHSGETEIIMHYDKNVLEASNVEIPAYTSAELLLALPPSLDIPALLVIQRDPFTDEWYVQYQDLHGFAYVDEAGPLPDTVAETALFISGAGFELYKPDIAFDAIKASQIIDSLPNIPGWTLQITRDEETGNFIVDYENECGASLIGLSQEPVGLHDTIVHLAETGFPVDKPAVVSQE